MDENNPDLQQTVSKYISRLSFLKDSKKCFKRNTPSFLTYLLIIKDYDLIKNECQNLEKKLRNQKNRVKNLADIIIEYLDYSQETEAQNIVYKFNLKTEYLYLNSYYKHPLLSPQIYILILKDTIKNSTKKRSKPCFSSFSNSSSPL